MKEITVIAEDRAGLVADVTEALASVGINLESIDAEALGATAVVRLTVDRYDDALRALAKAQFHALTEDAILVRLDDEPGGLARVARRFKDAGVNLRAVRLVYRDTRHKKAIVAIAAEKTDQAIALVKDVLIE
jgi:hypothetical protein